MFSEEKKVLNPKLAYNEKLANSIAEKTKDKWRIPFFIIAIISIIPSYYSIYYNNENNKLKLEKIKLTKQLNVLIETKTSFSKNDYSIDLKKDSLK